MSFSNLHPSPPSECRTCYSNNHGNCQHGGRQSTGSRARLPGRDAIDNVTDLAARNGAGALPRPRFRLESSSELSSIPQCTGHFSAARLRRRLPDRPREIDFCGFPRGVRRPPCRCHYRRYESPSRRSVCCGEREICGCGKRCGMAPFIGPAERIAGVGAELVVLAEAAEVI